MSGKNEFPGTFGHYRTESLTLFGFGDEQNDVDIDFIKLEVSYENEDGERYVRLDIIIECAFPERAARYEGLSNLCKNGWTAMPLYEAGGTWWLTWFKDASGTANGADMNEILQDSLRAMYSLVREYVNPESP
jgi:hypothetical protein